MDIYNVQDSYQRFTVEAVEVGARGVGVARFTREYVAPIGQCGGLLRQIKSNRWTKGMRISGAFFSLYEFLGKDPSENTPLYVKGGGSGGSEE